MMPLVKTILLLSVLALLNACVAYPYGGSVYYGGRGPAYYGKPGGGYRPYYSDRHYERRDRGFNGGYYRGEGRSYNGRGRRR